MIAQDFARVRVLGAFSRGARGETPRKKGDGSIAVPYGVVSTCAHAGKSAPQSVPSGSARGPAPPCEGAAALSVPGTMLEMGK